MPNQTPKYNLDENTGEEFFTFSVLENRQYKFIYPSGDDIKDLRKVDIKDAENQDVLNLFGKFIEPLTPETPPFEQTFGKMRIPKILAFKEMLTKELGAHEA